MDERGSQQDDYVDGLGINSDIGTICEIYDRLRSGCGKQSNYEYEVFAADELPTIVTV